MNNLTKRELNEIIKYCNPQEKSILLLMSSSGMSVDDICNLKYSDFLLSVSEYCEDKINPYSLEEIFDSIRTDDVIGTWEMMNLKSDFSYVTFCTEECMHSLIDWLYLSKGSECVNVDEPLFAGLPDRKKITPDDIESIFKRLRYETGISIETIDLRRFFVETLLSASVLIDDIMHCLGYEFNPNVKNNANNEKSLIDVSYLCATRDLRINERTKIQIDEHQSFLDEMRVYYGFDHN